PGAGVVRRAVGASRLRRRRARPRPDRRASAGAPVRTRRRDPRRRRRRAAAAEPRAPRRQARARGSARVTALARLALVGLVRSPARTAVRVVTVAVAVAPPAAILLFVAPSPRRATGSTA